MKKKFILFVSLFLCTALSFNSVGFALATSDDSIFVDELKINPRHGIVQGEFAQLTATLTPEDVSSSMVEWSSSNENVISCTKEGRIKGVSANGYADITCKAKFGKGTDTIRIYCAESIGGYYKDSLKDLFVSIYNQPGTSLSSTLYFNMSFIYEFIFSFVKKAWENFSLCCMPPLLTTTFLSDRVRSEENTVNMHTWLSKQTRVFQTAL